MTNIERHAVSCLKKVFGDREIYVNPEGYEPGFFHKIVPSSGAPYYSKIAYFVTPATSPFLIDVTGDSDKVLKYVD